MVLQLAQLWHSAPGWTILRAVTNWSFVVKEDLPAEKAHWLKNSKYARATFARFRQVKQDQVIVRISAYENAAGNMYGLRASLHVDKGIS